MPRVRRIKRTRSYITRPPHHHFAYMERKNNFSDNLSICRAKVDGELILKHEKLAKEKTRKKSPQ